MADEVVEEKVQTNFPGLQAANGVKPSQMEVIGAKPAAEVKPEGSQEQPNSTENPARSVAPEVQPSEAAPTAKAKINTEDLTDEEREELVLKLTGKSLSDLNPPAPPTKEELEAAAEKRKSDALAWAFENKKITKAEYDKAVEGKAKTNRELALHVFTKSLQEEDKDITAEEAEEIFKDTFHEDADGRLLAIGQKEINKLADAYRKEAFSAIDSIDEEYENFTTTQNQFKAYKSQVKTLAAELPKENVVSVKYKDVDGSEATLDYKIPTDQKVIDKIVSDFSKENSFVMRNIATDGKINFKDVQAELQYHLKAQTFDNAIAEALKQHGEEVEKRTIAILGNKRNPNQSLNDGKQNLPNAPQKVNVYTSLNEHASKQRN